MEEEDSSPRAQAANLWKYAIRCHSHFRSIVTSETGNTRSDADFHLQSSQTSKTADLI